MTGPGVPGPGGTLADLGPGTHVTVRHRVPDAAAPPGSRPLLADIVATVVAVGPERAELRRGDGASVSVRLDRVTAVRALPRPPGAGRPSDPFALARIAAAGWPAAETAWLGDWLLRAAGGWTRRANSALILRPPAGTLAAAPAGTLAGTLTGALAAVREWYTARDLPPLLAVPRLPDAEGLPGRPVLEESVLEESVLEAAGGRAEAPTVVLVARSADVLAAGDEPPEPPPVPRLSPEPSEAWLADYRDAATHPAAAAVLAGPPAPARVRFAELSDDDGRTKPMARARAVTDQGWVGLAAVGVAPEIRRTGVGRALVAALLTDGLRHGGVRSYVEVEAANSGALAFWRHLGYRRSHDCLYYRLPS